MKISKELETELKSIDAFKMKRTIVNIGGRNVMAPHVDMDVSELMDAHELISKKYNIRVFPKQKTNGHYGFEVYVKNEKDPIALPFVRLSGNNAFTFNYNSFPDAIDGGLVWVIKNLIKNG